MFSQLNYSFDAETGEIIVKDNKKISNNLGLNKNKNKNKKRSRTKKKTNYSAILTNEINNLEYGFDKNYILQSIKFARINLLEHIKNIIFEENVKVKNNEIDGLYLSNFLMINLLYQRKLINLDILRNEKDYLNKLKETITKYEKVELNELISHILSYIDFYFKDTL